MTHEHWGYVLIGIGLLFVYWATRQSTFPLYRLFLARYRFTGSKDGHRVFQFSGLAMIVMGVLMVSGVI